MDKKSAKDIKTFEKALQNVDYKEYFEVGEDFDESHTASIVQEALNTFKLQYVRL